MTQDESIDQDQTPPDDARTELEAAAVEMLSRVPERWAAFAPDDLSAQETTALSLLVAAELVERRRRFRLRMLNQSLAVKATITATGEYRLVEALKALAAGLWQDWQGAFAAWQASDAGDAPPVHGELLEPQEWRLTISGVQARGDRRALTEHVADFQSVLFSKGNNADYVNQAVARVKQVLSQCQADRIGRLTSSAVQAAIGRLRASGKSLATCNGYLRSIKRFTAWLHRDRRLREHPLRTLSTFNEAIDRRHVRREPTVAELTWLIDTTKRRTHENHSLPGPDRAMLYLLGVGTGLRASELRSLRKESFELDQDPPVVHVAAAYSKLRRDDAQPISGELAKIARAWLANKASGETLFGAMPGDTARMLRKDLTPARTAWISAATDEVERRERSDSDFLRYRNSAGAVLDFHSLRHAFISAVVNSGASVKVAQELARHGSPTLTIGRYSHVRLQDLRGALAAVPVVSESGGRGQLDVARP